MSPLRSDAASVSYGLSSVVDVQVRMPGQERGDGQRQHLRATERQRADANPALQPALARGDVGDDVAQLGQHPLEMEGDDLARHRRCRGRVPSVRRGRARGRLSRSFKAALIAGWLRPNSRATAAMLRRSARLAMTARRRPLRIDGEQRVDVGRRRDAGTRRQLLAGRFELALDAPRPRQHQLAVRC